MLAAWLIGGVLVLGGIIWGIITFVTYVEENYDYNVFDVWNIIMLSVMFLIWLVVLFYAYAGGESFDVMNYWICGIVSVILFVVMFIRNLKNTSLTIAIGATILQVAAVAVIAFIIVVVMFLSGYSKERIR